MGKTSVRMLNGAVLAVFGAVLLWQIPRRLRQAASSGVRRRGLSSGQLGDEAVGASSGTDPSGRRVP